MVVVRWSFLVWVVVLLTFSGENQVTIAADEAVQLYLDIHQVNTTESLRRISKLPIVYYKFLHDTVPDRVQLGAIGSETQHLFPESIEVLPSATFTNMSALAAGGRISTYSVRNFPIVDRNVLFMHGVAALQELIARYETLEGLVRTLSERDKIVYDDIRRAQDTLQQSINHQLATKLQTLELEARNMEAKLNLESEREAEETRKLQAKLAGEQFLLELEERLSRERMDQQEQSVRTTVAEQLEQEKELALRKDALQRENEIKLMEMRESQRQRVESKRLEYEKEKIRAETDAKIQQERMNEEIEVKKIQLRAKLETERMIQGIKSVGQQISSMVQRIFAHPEQLLFASGMFLGIVFCYYLIREFSRLVRQWIQQRLGRPVLVRETSYQWSILPSFLSALLPSVSSLSRSESGKNQHMRSWSSPKAMEELTKDFEDIILSTSDKERIIQLALATRNTKRSAAPYRHVLLHGPPGTGKTLIARRLAECSEMDYAILSGGDVAPLGEDAVNQLHDLFTWAQKSRRGLLVFIDEAEAFLCSRTGSGASTSSMPSAPEEANSSAVDASSNRTMVSQSMHLRNALNALLYQTGTPSRSFMMVLATNRPQDLDAAVLDRIDVSLHIGLPHAPQRHELIRLYLHVHVTQAAERAMQSWLSRWLTSIRSQLGFRSRYVSTADLNSTSTSTDAFIDPTCFSDMAMYEMIAMTRGFSGREISKLFISVQYVLLLSAEGRLTWPMLRDVVHNKVDEHRMKVAGFVTTTMTTAPGVPAIVSSHHGRAPVRTEEEEVVEGEGVDADQMLVEGEDDTRRKSLKTTTINNTTTTNAAAAAAVSKPTSAIKTSAVNGRRSSVGRTSRTNQAQ